MSILIVVFDNGIIKAKVINRVKKNKILKRVCGLL